MNYKIFSALVMCIAVTGCSGGKVLFNKEDPNSGYLKSTKLIVTFDDDPYCDYIKVPASAAIGLDAALAIGTIGYNLANREVNSIIDDKIAKYTYTYSAMTSYYPKSIDAKVAYQQMCFTFLRKVDSNKDGETRLEVPKEDEALSFDFNLTQFRDSKSFITQLKNIRLHKSGALTTDKKGIELIIGITVSTPKADSSEPKVISTTNFTLSNVKFIEGQPSYKEVFYGPLYNPIPNGTPVTVTVTVTEKGVGVKNLSDFKSDINNNSDLAKSLLGIAIKKEYE